MTAPRQPGPTKDPNVAVLDVGKSNAKLSLVAARRKEVLAARTRPNVVQAGPPYPHFDVEGMWRWFLDGLRHLGKVGPIDAIATTTHGACFALVADGRLAIPVFDYEYGGPDSVDEAYRAIRGGFDETLSPDLPGGLNVGRQLFWQSRTFADAFSRVETLLPYPQYWAMRLSGVTASEATSFGSHTDLWRPRDGTFSDLAERQGWTRLFPPMAHAWTVLGPVLPAVAEAAGLSADCRVLTGIHDSNATLLPHILHRPLPFALLSTGTWMITFAAGGSLDDLDPARDCLANVDVFRRPIPSAMAMAGREFEILCAGTPADPGHADVARVVAADIMALPAFVTGSGPFGGSSGHWSADPDHLSATERTAAASLYIALVAETCLDLAGAGGPIIVEGPFSQNRVFLGALAQRTGRAVIAPTDPSGTTEGAALLAMGPDAETTGLPDPSPVAPLEIDLTAYAAVWHEKAAAGRRSEAAAKQSPMENEHVARVDRSR